MGQRINTLAIIQARVVSTRLPRKVLLDLGGKTVLERVVERVGKSKMVDEVLVATTINVEDLAIIKLCAKEKIRVFVGSNEDVLDRYFQAANLLQPKAVVRITADCPLIDPKIIDLVVKSHLKSGADYTANTLELSYPDGQDVEVFSFEALETSWKNARLASEREHVTMFIKNHPKKFKLNNVANKIDYSAQRWTLDNAEDYKLLKKIYEALYKKNHYFPMEQTIDFLDKNSQLQKINRHISRNEGLQKSLQSDKIVKR